MAIKDFYPTITPSLNLDFADGKSVDPRITFSRASTATYTDSKGILRYAPTNNPRIDYDPVTGECKGLLIEEARTNLITYSDDFSKTSAWSVYAASIIQSNDVVSPAGTNNVSKIIHNLNTTGSYVGLASAPSLVAGTVYTISAYFKSFNKTLVTIVAAVNTSFGSTGGNAAATFDLSTGVVSNVERVDISATIANAGNGWYRCSITFTPTTTASFGCQFGRSATGDGVSGFYMWGAQLEIGAFATSYIPSVNTFTSRASTATYVGSDGLIKTAAINTARLNYTPTNLSVSPQLLLESASTNLLTYSEQFDVWAKNNATTVTNAIISPDGTSTAEKLVSDSTTSVTHRTIATLTSVAASTYTLSFFAKAGEESTIAIAIYNATDGEKGATFDLLNGTVSSTFNTPLSTRIVSFGNGWHRCSVTISTTVIANLSAILYLRGYITYNGDGVSGAYVWGAQLEALPYATSYIPTTGAAVTRSADVSTSAQTTRALEVAKIDGKNFTSWFNQTEGTFYAESDRNAAGGVGIQYIICEAGINASNNNELIQLGSQYGLNTMQFLVNSGGIGQGYLSEAGTTSISKYIGAYKLNDFAYTKNGANPITDSTGVLPNGLNQFNIGSRPAFGNSGYLNGHIKRISYYPTRLSNTQLQYLTK